MTSTISQTCPSKHQSFPVNNSCFPYAPRKAFFLHRPLPDNPVTSFMPFPLPGTLSFHLQILTCPQSTAQISPQISSRPSLHFSTCLLSTCRVPDVVSRVEGNQMVTNTGTWLSRNLRSAKGVNKLQITAMASTWDSHAHRNSFPLSPEVLWDPLSTWAHTETLSNIQPLH